MNCKICYCQVKSPFKGITAFLVLSCFFVCFILASAPQYERDELTRSEVDANLGSVFTLVTTGYKEEGENRSIDATFIDGFIHMVDFIANYPDIERITGVSNEWYKDLIKNLKEMREPRERMDTAIMNKDEEEYQAAEIKYEASKKKFIELMKHPQKAKGRK